MEEEYEKTLSDYLHIAIRRKYVIAVCIIILMTISLIISLVLPAIYRSEGTILIEQQHIPTDLVKSTVISFASNRIRKIQQKIMTSSNVNEIIRKYKIYPKEKEYLRYSELIDLFRQNVSLDFIEVDTLNNKGRKILSTIAFKLSFNHKNKHISKNVVNDLMESFINENTLFRINTTKETSNFLETAAENFKTEIHKIEKNIALYKIKYSGSLPELLPVNLSAISRIENSIQQLSFQENILIKRKVSLQNQIYLIGSSNIPSTGSINSIEGLKHEYMRLLGKYSALHPDVIAIKRKIDSFDIGSIDNINNDLISNPIYYQLKSELDIVKLELENINKERNNSNTRLNKIEHNVAQTHQVEQGYYELIGDLESQKEKYKEIRGKFLEAKLSEILEKEEKAEKFSILEPASLPTKQYKPNRIKILFIGFILSILGGLFIGFIIENIDNSIRGYKELESIIGSDPIIVIPYINNEEDKDISRNNKVNFVIFICVFIIISIISIHFLYMNLYIIFEKIFNTISML